MNAIPMRKLKAQMVLKDLSLKDVSRRSGVPYQQCSEILNGTRVHAGKARLIRGAIESAPTPKELVA
jgi:hypothetical protein